MGKRAPARRRTAKDLSAEFAVLLGAAGLNPDKLLRELARRSQRQLVTRTTLYDWKSGAHLPEDEATFLAVVRVCLRCARERGVRPPVPEEAGWVRLLADARKSRDSVSVRNPGAGASRSRNAWIAARDWDPVRLGVHVAIGGDPLPAYVRREHDDLLDALLDPDVAANRLVVLRGDSSTGKSRSAYQAICAGRLAPWRLEYPLTPAGLARRIDDGLPARTVLWLGELRDYADSDGGAEALEKLAGLLMEHRHVIAVTTVWPAFWDAYTRGGYDSGPGTPNHYAAVRALLAGLPVLITAGGADPSRGAVIDVPAGFTHHELARAGQSRDPALAEALDAAAREHCPGQVTQYLAGVPDLLRHYQNPSASPYGRAVIAAAMDAARMGPGRWLPTREFLEDAAIGYLSDAHRVIAADAWCATALEYATRALRGAVRALKPVPPATGTGVAAYQLADCLDQHARRHLAGTVPPPAFWKAAADHAPPVIKCWLVDSAEDLGLLRCAAELAKSAAPGDGFAGRTLIRSLYQLDPSDERPAQWTAENVSLREPWKISALIDELRAEGWYAQITTLLNRRPEIHADIHDAHDAAVLLNVLRTEGRDAQAATLLHRYPAARAELGNDAGVASLLRELRAFGADDQAAALLERGRAIGSRVLLQELGDSDARQRMIALARREVAHVDIRNPTRVAHLLGNLRKAGATAQAALLLDRDPAAHVSLRFPGALASLVRELHETGANAQVDSLARRILNEDAGMEWEDRLRELLLALRKAGADAQAAALAHRAATQVTLTDPATVYWLTQELEAGGARAAAAVLLDRNPAAHVGLSSSYGVAGLLSVLLETGRGSQLAALLSRNPAAHVALDDPDGVGWLLTELRAAGEGQQVAVLAERVPAATADLCAGDETDGMQRLLRALHEVGADAQAEALNARLPSADQYRLRSEYDQDYNAAYKFGREPDGRPSGPWGWDDLA